jgi:signal transduction histidine kinase
MLELAPQMSREYPTDYESDTGTAAVLRNGQPLFIREVTDEMLVAGARDARHLEYARRLEFTSIIVVPMIARGLTLGTLTLCTTLSGRQYDEMDLAVAQDLAQRAAIAVDNARLFREAQQARAEAEAANSAKAQFLATMSHELRTPLNAIQGHAQLMELELHGPVTAEQRSALERIDRAQRHLLGLINDILTYARVESGKVEYKVAPVRIGDVVSDVMPMIEPQLLAKGIRCEIGLGSGDENASPLVLADREKLAQILLNLFSNATKFTPHGGTVVLDIAERAAAPGPRDLVFVRMRDTGIGVPPDKLEAIFQPFVQVRDTYEGGRGGTGLGLAISRDLARGMGGDVRARNAEGGGAVFTIALRAAEPVPFTTEIQAGEL